MLGVTTNLARTDAHNAGNKRIQAGRRQMQKSQLQGTALIRLFKERCKELHVIYMEVL